MSIDDRVTRQAGVISLSQAVAHGVSARTVRRRVASGAWEVLHPRVYLVGGHRLTDETRVRSAALWAGGRQAAGPPRSRDPRQRSGTACATGLRS